jgi:hypothetical protein
MRLSRNQEHDEDYDIEDIEGEECPWTPIAEWRDFDFADFHRRASSDRQ